MKRLYFILALWAFFSVATSVFSAEEQQKSGVPRSSASGGMTYSATQGWVKTDSQHMKVGTDSLVYQNQKQAIADAVKQNREKIAREKAEAEAKEKLWQEAKKAEAEKLAGKPEAFGGSPVNKVTTTRKRKKPSGHSRVFIS